MPRLPLYIKAKFYTKLAFVLLKANVYAYYFRTKYPKLDGEISCSNPHVRSRGNTSTWYRYVLKDHTHHLK